MSTYLLLSWMLFLSLIFGGSLATTPSGNGKSGFEVWAPIGTQVDVLNDDGLWLILPTKPIGRWFYTNATIFKNYEVEAQYGSLKQKTDFMVPLPPDKVIIEFKFNGK